MFWRLLLVLLIVLGSAGYWLWGCDVAVPQIRYFSAAAFGGHAVRKIRIVGIREKMDGNTGEVTYSWKVVFTGGPLARSRELVTLEVAPTHALAAGGQFHRGGRVPAIFYFGRWLPVVVVKWDTLACGAGPLLALGVLGLIIRCVVGPRAFPNNYEPATHDYSADFAGVPTLRPALVGLIGLTGFLALCSGMAGKWLVSPGNHFCYWLAISCLCLFLVSGPVAMWCVLPHFHRVRTPDE